MVSMGHRPPESVVDGPSTTIRRGPPRPARKPNKIISSRSGGVLPVRRSWHGPRPTPGPDSAARRPEGPARRDPAEGRPRLAGGLGGHARDPAAVCRASGRYLARAADGGRDVAPCLPDPARRTRLPLAPAPPVIRLRILDRDRRHALGGRLVPAR